MNAPRLPSFTTPEGRGIARAIIRQRIGFDPHDFQLECVCKALDGINVFAITATGDGKSGIFSMYMACMQALADDSTIPRPEGFEAVKNPAMVAICPTKSLEEMSEAMKKLGFESVAINVDTLEAARRKKQDLWARARQEATFVFLAPEQLNTVGFWNAIEDPYFWTRTVAALCDEVHLTWIWGKKFRKAFGQIGLVRARLRSSIVIFALTATMESGAPFCSVCQSLGLRDGEFFLLRRSNIRHDIQLCVRNLKSGINGCAFPELLWILWHHLSGPSVERP